MVKVHPAQPTTGGKVGKVAWIVVDNTTTAEFPTALKGQALADGKSITQADSIFALSGSGTAATGTVTMTGLPLDTETLIIDDGFNPPVTYQFDAGTTPTDTATLQGVTVGVDAAATITNLINQINAPTAGCVIDITAAEAAGDVADLTNDDASSIGNIAITDAASNTTVTGMSGGVVTDLISGAYLQPISFTVSDVSAGGTMDFTIGKHDLTPYPGLHFDYGAVTVPHTVEWRGVTLNEGLSVAAAVAGASGILSYRVYGADV